MAVQPDTGAGALLSVRGLDVSYGAVRALSGVDLDVRSGEVVCVLGVNGAGKTSLLSAISGMVRPAAGVVVLDGTEVQGLRPEEMVRRGAALVPEGRQIFPTMSVRDNLLMGAYAGRRRPGLIGEGFERVFDLFPVLAEMEHRQAASLSGGEQQMLAIGRSLMGGPRLLMLDEPSLGLAPRVVQRLMEVIASLAERDLAVILVEQLARLALTVADRGYLLEAGRVVLSGTSAELQADDRVREIYMGVRR